MILAVSGETSHRSGPLSGRQRAGQTWEGGATGSHSSGATTSTSSLLLASLTLIWLTYRDLCNETTERARVGVWDGEREAEVKQD